MITVVASRISNWLIHRGLVPQCDSQIFTYAAYCLILGLAPFFMTLILGIFLDMIHESILLIIPYMMIRKFSGGFHLRSAKKCLLVSAVVLTTALLAVRFFSMNYHTVLFSVLVSGSSISLCMNSPIDSDARKLSVREQQVFRYIAQIISLLALITYYLLLSYSALWCSVSFGMGIILAATLQLPCLLVFLGSRHRIYK